MHFIINYRYVHFPNLLIFYNYNYLGSNFIFTFIDDQIYLTLIVTIVELFDSFFCYFSSHTFFSETIIAFKFNFSFFLVFDSNAIVFDYDKDGFIFFENFYFQNIFIIVRW